MKYDARWETEKKAYPQAVLMGGGGGGRDQLLERGNSGSGMGS